MISTNELDSNSPRINIFNRQRKISLDSAALQIFCQALAERMGLEKEFSICLVSDRKMRQLNQHFAGKDKPTDVLSFPNTPESWEEKQFYAGDIVISVETAERQKRSTLENELKVLSLHGVLHLIGYDHEVDEGEMRRLEKKLKRELGLK